MYSFNQVFLVDFIQTNFNFSFNPFSQIIIIYLFLPADMIQYILTIILILGTLLYYKMYVKPKKLHEQYAKNIQKLGYKPLVIPFKCGGFPFVAILKQGQKQGDSFKFAKQNYKDYDVLVTNLFNRIFINFINPDFIKEFFNADNLYIYPKQSSLQGSIKEAIGEGLFLSEGDIWKRKRRIIAAVFNFDFLKSSTYKIKDICTQAIKKLEAESPLAQFEKDGAKCKAYEYKLIDSNIEMFSSVVMEFFLGGISSQKFDGEEVCSFVNKLIIDLTQQGFEKRIMIFGPKIAKLGLTKKDRDLNRRVKIFRQWVIEYIRQQIQESKEKIKKCSGKFVPKDLIQALVYNSLSAENGHENVYTELEIFEQFCTFLVAGTDTTSHFTLMMLYYLALHPEAEKKVREQIQKYMKTDDYSYENLKNFIYIDWVQKQTGRMYGIGHNIFPRVALKDNYINGLAIKKGTMVSIVQTGNHYSEKFFKNPLEFRPERWQNQCEDLPLYAYGIFSGGARTCIGKLLAFLQNKIAIILYLKRYKQIILPKKKINMAFKFVYSPQYLVTKQVINQ